MEGGNTDAEEPKDRHSGKEGKDEGDKDEDSNDKSHVAADAWSGLLSDAEEDRNDAEGIQHRKDCGKGA